MKKGIIVVSFGTSYEQTRKRCIESIENKIRSEFTQCKVARAFTSNFIIKKLKERDGVHVNTVSEAIQDMKSDGIEHIYVQPLHMIPGFEYEKVKRAVSIANHDKALTVTLGMPLLNEEEDYEALIHAVRTRLPKLGDAEGVILMGHGTEHFANACYSMLQAKFKDVDPHVFIANVEGYPELDHIIDHLSQYKKMTLMPLMIVAGDHAQNDMAGDDDDSFKSMLEEKGISVECIVEGLGENPGVQEIFSNRVKSLL